MFTMVHETCHDVQPNYVPTLPTLPFGINTAPILHSINIVDFSILLTATLTGLVERSTMSHSSY